MRSQAASSEVQEALKAGLTEMAGAHSALAKARSARGRPARPGGSTARSVEEERVGRLPAARRRAHGEAAKIIDLGNGDYAGPPQRRRRRRRRTLPLSGAIRGSALPMCALGRRVGIHLCALHNSGCAVSHLSTHPRAHRGPYVISYLLEARLSRGKSDPPSLHDDSSALVRGKFPG